MELQITTLIENEPDERAELAFEHGLSLWIEFDGKKLLFDTGQTGAFLDNAARLGKKVEEADCIFISHGHYDHSGGVPRLLEALNQKKNLNAISLYVGAEFFRPKYKKLPDASMYYNGNPFTEAVLTETSIELHKISADVTPITERIMVFKNFTGDTEYEKPDPKFYVGQDVALDGQRELPFSLDEFVDEIALGLLTTKGLVLIVGCSHVGIVNILQKVTERTGLPIYSVLGGTHLVEADEDRLQKTVKAFRDLGLQQVAVSHCTGEQGIELVKKEFGENFIRNNTGNIYSL